MAQNDGQNQTLPSITQLTSELPHPDPNHQKQQSMYHRSSFPLPDPNRLSDLNRLSGTAEYFRQQPLQQACESPLSDHNRLSSLSQQTDMRDSGNWSQSKRESPIRHVYFKNSFSFQISCACQMPPFAVHAEHESQSERKFEIFMRCLDATAFPFIHVG